MEEKGEVSDIFINSYHAIMGVKIICEELGF